MPSNKPVPSQTTKSPDQDHVDQDCISAGQQPLIVILGPTAVGKTEIAIQLANKLNGEIISADSTLIYRGMDIGTAKPSAQQREQIPHYLIDVTDPDQTWSLTLYQRAAQRVIKDIQARGRLPFLVGGTGQYIHAVVYDWQIPKIKPDKKLRQALEDWSSEIGSEGLHTRLSALDPKAAAKIDFRNTRRTIRALEVIFRSGRRFSDQRLSGRAPYCTIQIGINLPRPELYARIDQRIDAMISAGFIEEVNTLLSKGYPADLPAFSAIGYKELINYLQGEISLDEAVTIIKRRTRQFVRRQANWFKDTDPQIQWFLGDGDAVERILSLLCCKLQLD